MSQVSLPLPGVLDIDRSERDPQDRYYTPQSAIDRLAAAVEAEKEDGEPAPLRRALRAASLGGVIEPSAGGGALLRGLAQIMTAQGVELPDEVVACDLDPRPDRDLGFKDEDVWWVQGDFRDRPWGLGLYGLSIQNPPFSLAEESIRQSRKIADYTLALVRLTFLESAKRAAWLSSDMPHVYVLAERPKFLGTTSSDSATCAWLLWTPGRPRRFATVRVLP